MKTNEDVVTFTLLIKQKRDKFAGVLFGRVPEETYQKALANLNAWVPVHGLGVAGGQRVAGVVEERSYASQPPTLGGVSMSLGNSNWEAIVKKEYIADGTLNRSGMVAGSDCSIYLIVTDADYKTSPKEFREAIQKHFGIQDGSSSGFMGVLLDGSTCSQLRCYEKSVEHPRGLLPLIVLINK